MHRLDTTANEATFKIEGKPVPKVVRALRLGGDGTV
jgi:hypothetical protein